MNSDYDQKCKLMGRNKKLKSEKSELEDKIIELELSNEQLKKELHLLKIYNFSTNPYKKGFVYLVDLNKNRCEIKDETDDIYYNCFDNIKIDCNLLSKYVFFELDKKHTPHGNHKQNVIIREII